jgi:hypothetical protein
MYPVSVYDLLYYGNDDLNTVEAAPDTDGSQTIQHDLAFAYYKLQLARVVVSNPFPFQSFSASGGTA